MMIDRRFFLGAAALCALACASGGHTAAAQTPQVETVNPGQLTVVFSPAAPPTSPASPGFSTPAAPRRLELSPTERQRSRASIRSWGLATAM